MQVGKDIISKVTPGKRTGNVFNYQNMEKINLPSNKSSSGKVGSPYRSDYTTDAELRAFASDTKFDNEFKFARVPLRFKVLLFVFYALTIGFSIFFAAMMIKDEHTIAYILLVFGIILFIPTAYLTKRVFQLGYIVNSDKRAEVAEQIAVAT